MTKKKKVMNDTVNPPSVENEDEDFDLDVAEEATASPSKEKKNDTHFMKIISLLLAVVLWCFVVFLGHDFRRAVVLCQKGICCVADGADLGVGDVGLSMQFFDRKALAAGKFRIDRDNNGQRVFPQKHGVEPVVLRFGGKAEIRLALQQVLLHLSGGRLSHLELGSGGRIGVKVLGGYVGQIFVQTAQIGDGDGAADTLSMKFQLLLPCRQGCQCVINITQIDLASLGKVYRTALA